jgi:predicted RNA binding protein YcfA (HicA-like mRNA interferase family)
MVKLNRISSRKVIQKLKKAGFVETHQRGSHLYFKNEDGTKFITVPVHGSADIPVGTLYNIVVRQAGLTVEYFNEL